MGLLSRAMDYRNECLSVRVEFMLDNKPALLSIEPSGKEYRVRSLPFFESHALSFTHYGMLKKITHVSENYGESMVYDHLARRIVDCDDDNLFDNNSSLISDLHTLEEEMSRFSEALDTLDTSMKYNLFNVYEIIGNKHEQVDKLPLKYDLFLNLLMNKSVSNLLGYSVDRTSHDDGPYRNDVSTK